MRRIRYLLRKEFLEIRQNPRQLGVLIVAPILQLTLLGYAATIDVRNVPVVVADADRSSRSRELIARFDASPYFTVVNLVTTTNEVGSYLERGRAAVALVIPAGYGRNLSARPPAIVQAIADGSDANSTTVALGYATNLMAAYAEELSAADPGARAVRTTGDIEARVRVWFNPEMETRDFMIPGVLALLLLAVTANLSSMGIVRERELGTLEQLNVTPLKRWELIIGKLLPYGIIGMVDVALVIPVATLWFEVPLRGSVWLLVATSMVYLLTTLGLGLFVSTISRTQQQAMMTTTFFFLMPMVYLSGFVFPIENMPRVIQLVTYLLPLRYFLIIVRGIFLKGTGLQVLWPEVLALVGWGVGMLALATARSRKQLR
ncbi:MAG: ABC transporter permease [Acidobacteria bacterium]|nr:ABC transporter permease [Acidobacteriota bacterium]